MAEIYNLCWGEQREDSDKKSWHQVGMLIVSDNGNISVKINTLPRMGVKWDGWLSAFKQDNKNNNEIPKEKSYKEPF